MHYCYDIVQVNVSYTDAILGSVYTVDTSSGPRKLLIPPGTQHGARLLAEDKLPENFGGHESGYQRFSYMFEVQLKLPTKLCSREQDLLSQIGSNDEQQGYAC